MAVVVVNDARSETFAFGLVTAVLLFALASASLLLPIATCPICPPDIFLISINVTVPGMPIMDSFGVPRCCGGSHKVSLFNQWRLRHMRSILVY